MRRLLRVRRTAIAVLTLICLAATLTGCSKVDTKRWRKTFGTQLGEQYVLVVSVPLNNPEWETPEGQNQTEWFVDAVLEAVANWDSHPDITVIPVIEEGNVNTCDFFRGNVATDWNCINAWMVPNAAIAPNAGVASVWADAQYRYNGSNPAEPSRFAVVEDWSSQGANADVSRRNAVCHELGHTLGLQHADMVDLDEDPGTGVDGKEYQPPGPCQDAVPDRDQEAPYDLAGFDWQNIDELYDTCHNDASGPLGGGVVDPIDDLDTIGYDECGSFSAQAESQGEPGPLTMIVDGDTFDAFAVSP
jgi:hypothetical protein